MECELFSIVRTITVIYFNATCFRYYFLIIDFGILDSDYCSIFQRFFKIRSFYPLINVIKCIESNAFSEDRIEFVFSISDFFSSPLPWAEIFENSNITVEVETEKCFRVLFFFSL